MIVLCTCVQQYFYIYTCVQQYFYIYTCVQQYFLYIYMCTTVFFIYIHVYNSIFIYIHVYNSIFIYIHVYNSIFIYIYMCTTSVFFQQFTCSVNCRLQTRKVALCLVGTHLQLTITFTSLLCNAWDEELSSQQIIHQICYATVPSVCSVNRACYFCGILCQF